MNSNDTWVFTVGLDGRVLDTNRAAQFALGPVRGRRCCDVLRVMDGHGETDCSAHCAAELLTGGGEPRDVHGRVARKVTGRVVCDRVGEVVVVSVLPIGERRTDPVVPLSPREREVLGLVAEGLTNALIARRLRVSPATVRTHVEHARDKLGASTRAEAVARAIAYGEVALP